MSTTFAIDLPDFVSTSAEQHPRHIEIVATRDQKRARPRVVYAIVGVCGLFVILIAQLLLSIWLSDGAYQIASLQQTQRELLRDQQTFVEFDNVLQSPQNLARQAAALGMVTNTGSQGFLSLANGVLRAPTAATGDTTVAADASALTPNILITPEVLSSGPPAAAGTAAAAASAVGGAAVGAAPAATETPGVSSNAASAATGSSTASTSGTAPSGGIPAPVTH